MNRAFLPLALLALLAACSPQSNLQDPVARGERDFNGLGCVKCHAIGGQGGAWAPDLSMIGFRKSSAWLDQWLKNPHEWNPKTVMPNFNLPEATRADLVAYLSAQKGQAWPTRPWMTDEAKALPAAERGRIVFEHAGCVTCHAKDGYGGYPNNNVAGNLIPSLSKVSETYSLDELKAKIKFGSTPIPTDTTKPAPMLQMPKWGQQLKDEEIDLVAAYLMSMKPKAAPGAKPADDF